MFHVRRSALAAIPAAPALTFSRDEHLSNEALHQAWPLAHEKATNKPNNQTENHPQNQLTNKKDKQTVQHSAFQFGCQLDNQPGYQKEKEPDNSEAHCPR